MYYFPQICRFFLFAEFWCFATRLSYCEIWIRITIQKNIELNRMISNQGTNSELDGTIGHAIIETSDQDMNVKPALLDATDITNSEMPVATSSPKAKVFGPVEANEVSTPVVPDATLTPVDAENKLLQDATTDPSNVAPGNKNTMDPIASKNKESAGNAKEASDNEQKEKNNDQQTDDASTSTPAKPKRGEFHTRIVGIRRQKDPRAFKCSYYNKHMMTLWELNAHFINTHRQVKCDMCNQYFNTPSSLKKHKYTHSDEKYACRSCDCEFPFKSQLHSHHHSHHRGRSYFCVYAGCNKSDHQPGDLNAHAKTHYTPLLSCEHCDYSTHDKRNLKSHLRKHTKIQLFQCK